MSSIAKTRPYQPERLEEALAEFEQAREEGRSLDREAFLARYPGLTAELGPLLQAAERIDQVARPLRQALEGRAVAPFPQLEEYTILEEIGRGGMGVVYKARQKGTEQIVALKMLHPDWIERLDLDSQHKAIGQFQFEVQAAARLRHPNRVRILHLGQQDGRPFYAMELIEGKSLAEKIKQAEGVSKEAALRYLASIAEAVHEAHQRGILHRDLKPHNILIDERTDEALLSDFGLAKMDRPAPAVEVCEESVRSQVRLAGTIPYMSPEQTEDADRVTPASDVYSLGATLYELLTGKPPFEGKSRQELIDRIRYKKVVPPRKRRPGVSPRIEAICLKCLEKDPEERYRTALEFAQELRRYLQDVRHAGNFVGMGTLMLVLAPVVLLINLGVYLLIQHNAWEPFIWLLMFSMYPALFSVFLLAPPKDSGHEGALSRRELWGIWGGKLFAALSISIALRVHFATEPKTALLLVYPVFAALSGMAVFAWVSKMPRVLYLLAAGCWFTGIYMMIGRLERAPLYYGLACLVGCSIWGLYLRKLGKELS